MTAQPGGRSPAPPDLVPLQDLLNTVNLETGEDQLGPSTFAGWCADQGVPDAAPTDRARLQQLREDLRGWVATHADEVPGAVAAGVVAAELEVTVAGGRFTTTSASAFGRLAAPVVAGIVAAQRDGRWSRLKVCDKPTCRWAFYDRSPTNSSRWCSSAVCGAREKARRAYRRRLDPARRPLEQGD